MRQRYLSFLFLSLFFCRCFIYAEEVTNKYEEVKDLCTLKILTPSLHKRETAKIRLENGLEAYLISDPNATQSAAALAMEAGSWADTKDFPGIAHFAEHLLFLGSEKYPKENGYHRQVDDHGGICNAFTANDLTCYMFSVNHDAFAETLDYFAHMFIDPLFTPSGIGRELHAVEQEYQKNIENDDWRAYMVYKATGNPTHPNFRFSIGNKETLGDIPQREVIKWWKEHYSADKAHLVLFSSLPIYQLKKITADLFSSLPKTNSIKKPYPTIPMGSPMQQGSLVGITPVQDIRALDIVWEIPKKYVKNIDNNAHILLSYLLMSKHNGGLYEQLEKEGLIEDIEAAMEPLSKEDSLFHIYITLTPKGVTQYEYIIDKCYQYIQHIKKEEIPAFVFTERQKMAALDYAYQSQEHPFLYVSYLGRNIVKEPLDTFPQKLSLLSKLDKNQNHAFLDYLSPDLAIYFLIASPELSLIPPDRIEKWFGVEYAVKKIDHKKLMAWKNNEAENTLLLPKPNPFIPYKVELIEKDPSCNNVLSPLLLADEPGAKIYFWKDDHYRVPEVHWKWRIRSPVFNGSTKSAVLGDLFLKTIEKELSTTLYYANAAGLFAEFEWDKFDLVLTIYGYSEHAKELLDIILNASYRLTPEQFELEKSLLFSRYANFEKAMPILQAQETLSHLLFNNYQRESDKLASLPTISYEEFLTFSQDFFHQTYIEAILAGNMSKEEAQKVWEKTKESLSSTPYLRNHQKQSKLLLLPKDQGPYKISKKTKSLGNAALLLLQQGAFSFEKKAAALILENALKQDFFDTLRTKQQTGYITRMQTWDKEGEILTFFAVQSSTHEPEELIARFELFLESYIKDFDSFLSEGRFESIRNTLITKLQMPPPNLFERTSLLERFAFTYNGDFHRALSQIAALKNITYSELKEMAFSFFSRQNSKRVAILLESNAENQCSFRYQETTAKVIKEEGSYISKP